MHLLRGAFEFSRSHTSAHVPEAGKAGVRCAASASFAAVHRYSFRIDRIDEDGASERGRYARRDASFRIVRGAILWEKSRQLRRTNRAADRPLTSSRSDIHDREAYPWRSDSI